MQKHLRDPEYNYLPLKAFLFLRYFGFLADENMPAVVKIEAEADRLGLDCSP